MNLMTPPEVADGGYWYRVPAEVVDGNTRPAGIGDVPYCGWPTGDAYVIRVLEPLTGIDTLTEVAIADHLAALGYTDKPEGRIGGA